MIIPVCKDPGSLYGIVNLNDIKSYNCWEWNYPIDRLSKIAYCTIESPPNYVIQAYDSYDPLYF